MTIRTLLVLPLFLAGCIAIPTAQLKVTAPEIRGRVVDNDTGKAVSGAKVYFESREDLGVTTGSDGRFVLPRQRDLVLMKVFTPCPVYEYPKPRRLPGAIVIETMDRRTQSFDLRPHYQEMPRARGNSNWASSDWEDPTLDLGDVRLTL